MKSIKSIYSLIGAACTFITSNLGLPASAVKIFLGTTGNKITTAGSDSETLPIASPKPLVEEDFNLIAKWAKKNGYKHIALHESVILEKMAAKSLATPFLTLAFDDFCNAFSVLANENEVFNKLATVRDVLSFVEKESITRPFNNSYIILSADSLCPEFLSEAFIKEEADDNKLSSAYLKCKRYYHTCDMNKIEGCN